MPSCAVFGCKNIRRKGTLIKFHSFPKDDELCKKWVEACKRPGKINTLNARVCSVHFSKDCYLIPLRQRLLNYTTKNCRNLVPDAVPTLLIPESKSEVLSHKQKAKISKAKRKSYSETTKMNLENDIETGKNALLINKNNSQDVANGDTCTVENSPPKRKIKKAKQTAKAVRKRNLLVHTLPIENKIGERNSKNLDYTLETFLPTFREAKSKSKVVRSSLADEAQMEVNDVPNNKEVNDNSEGNSRQRKAKAKLPSRCRREVFKGDAEAEGILLSKEKDDENDDNNKQILPKQSVRKTERKQTEREIIILDDSEAEENSVLDQSEKDISEDDIQTEFIVENGETVHKNISYELEIVEEDSWSIVQNEVMRLRAENENLEMLNKKYESDRVYMYHKLKTLKNNPASLNRVLPEMLSRFSPAEKVIAMLSKAKRT